MTRRYLVTDKSGAPTGIVDADLIVDQATALAVALAAAADDEDRCVTIAGDLLEKVGSVEFGYICSNALLTMAVEILGPLLEATDAAGGNRRPIVRAVSAALLPDEHPSITDPEGPKMTTSQETPSTRKHRARRQPAARATPSTLQTTQKRADAIRLRLAGCSYDQIAERLGYANRSSAFKAVEAGRLAILAEPAREMVALECARLDELMVALWPQALAGDVQAVDRVLRIMERRARYLGLDAPARTEQSDGVLQVVFNPALAPQPLAEIDRDEHRASSRPSPPIVSSW